LLRSGGVRLDGAGTELLWKARPGFESGEELRSLGHALPQLPSLQTLKLVWDTEEEDECNAEAGDFMTVGRRLPAALRHISVMLPPCKTVRDASIGALARGLPRSLHQLELRAAGTSMGNVGLRALAESLPLGLQLLRLDLGSCRISDSGLRAMGKGLPASLMQLELACGSSAASDAGLAALTQHMPDGLVQLRIDLASRHSKLSEWVNRLPEGLRHLQLCARSPLGRNGAKWPSTLSKLILEIDNASDTDVCSLAQHFPANLKHLVVRLHDGSASLSDAGLCALAERFPVTLQHLEVRTSVEGGSSLSALADHLPPGLECLEAHICACAWAKQLPKTLQRLEVFGAAGGDVELHALARLLPGSLRHLGISIGGVSDTGLSQLANLLESRP